MGLGPTARPSLAHSQNSNQGLLNPTVLISPYGKQKIQYMKSKKLIVVFSSGVYLAGNPNAPKKVYLPLPPVSVRGPVFASKIN